MTNAELQVYGRRMQSIVRDRAINAVDFCEAYEGSSNCIVYDGSSFSPSWRVLPYGELVWQAAHENEDLIEAFDQFVDDLEGEEVTAGWFLWWEDGILWAYSDWHGQD